MHTQAGLSRIFRRTSRAKDGAMDIGRPLGQDGLLQDVTHRFADFLIAGELLEESFEVADGDRSSAEGSEGVVRVRICATDS